MEVNIPWVGGSIYPWYIDPLTHGISTPLPMVYRPPTLYNYWLLIRSTHDQVCIVMSRLKLKVNNCLLNNNEFFKLFNSIFNKIDYNCFIIFQDYLKIKIFKYDEIFELWNFIYFFLIFKFSNFLKLLNFKLFFGKFWPPTDGISTPLPMEYRPPYPWYINPLTYGILTSLPMAYRPPYPWYFDPPTHVILTPLPMVYRPPYTWYFDPPTHGILNPLPMVFWPTYPWYIDPPTHGILNPLPMVYRPPYPWYFDPPTHRISTPYTWYFDLTAYFFIINGGVQNTMGVQFTIQGGVQFSIRGFNIPWM